MNKENFKENQTPFERLNGINVKDNTKKKGNFSYLSWTWAWAELQKVYPLATYEIVKFDGLPYKENSRNECMVFTKLTVDNITHEMWLPVMDYSNKAVKNPDMMAINKTIMRCLVKNIAMFGLGLYIYAGEDLPDTDDVTEEKSIIETRAVVEKIQMDFEKEKRKLLETKDITQLKTIFITIYNNKLLFTPEQFIELETIKNNKKEHFEN